MTRSRLALGLSALLIAGCASSLDKARNAWDAGELEQAAALYQEAMKGADAEIAKEELANMYLEQAQEYEKNKKWRQAEEYYRLAREANPASEEAQTGLANLLRTLRRDDEALAVAREGAAAGSKGCRRVLGVLLISRGDARIQAQDWAGAEADYSEAMAILPDTAVALALVRARLGQENLGGAAEALQQAADLISAADSRSRQYFLELRRHIVLTAVAAGDVATADRLLDLAPPGVTGDEQLGLAVEVAMEFRKKGEPDAALQRMGALVDAAESGAIPLTDQRKAELRVQVATLHAARAALRLTRGELDGAEKDLERALALNPRDPALQLQKVLILAGRGKFDEAKAALRGIADGTQGHAEVEAVLLALEVDRLLAAGKTRDARAVLDRAQAKAPDLPEVHVAMAQMLAVTPVDDLSRSEVAEVAKNGLVAYPEGKIVRVGEALSELDWSKQQLTGLGATYPYRGPDTRQRIETLESEIRKYFPYAVKFQQDPTTTLVLENKGSAEMKVKLEGKKLASEVSIPAGGTQRVTVPQPGFVRLQYRGTTAAVVTEPYTELHLPL